MARPKVMLFLIHEYTRLNGGTLWHKYFLQTIAKISDIEFVVVSATFEKERAASESFVRILGLEHFFIPLEETLFSEPPFLRLLKNKYYFLPEREFLRASEARSKVQQVVAKTRPDLVVILYLYSALLLSALLQSDIPLCLITLNNEAAFQRALRIDNNTHGKNLPDKLKLWVERHFNWIADMRFRRFEHQIYMRCTGIATLTNSDLPACLPDKVEKAVLPPIPKKLEQRWAYHGTRSLFFVGNITYFPNRLALEWLCTSFSRELLTLDNTVRINAIGASPDQVPSAWSSPNVHLLGVADRSEVTRQMVTADLFLAPIANAFGAKMKLAECISHGMPFLATQAAMSGLPFLIPMQYIELQEPAAAARLALNYLDNPSSLIALSESVEAQVERVRTQEVPAWNAFLNRCAGRVPHPADRPIIAFS
jgi:glycosyl transferase family 1